MVAAALVVVALIVAGVVATGSEVDLLICRLLRASTDEVGA